MSIQAIFYKFLDHRTKVNNDLARLNLMYLRRDLANTNTAARKHEQVHPPVTYGTAHNGLDTGHFSPLFPTPHHHYASGPRSRRNLDQRSGK